MHYRRALDLSYGEALEKSMARVSLWPDEGTDPPFHVGKGDFQLHATPGSKWAELTWKK